MSSAEADVRYPEQGTRAEFAKTITESDVHLFAGITGDLAPQHVNAEYMERHAYGSRVAHGVLVLGLASTVSARLSEAAGITVVSYGYDKVRFLRPVFLGDTVTVSAEVVEVDPGARRTVLDITARTQDGTTCLYARHLLHHIGDVVQG